MSKNINITIRLNIEDTESLLKEISKYLDCDISEISHEDVEEFIENHISVKNTANNLFLVEGKETDGFLIKECNCSSLFDI